MAAVGFFLPFSGVQSCEVTLYLYTMFSDTAFVAAIPSFLLSSSYLFIYPSKFKFFDKWHNLASVRITAAASLCGYLRVFNMAKMESAAVVKNAFRSVTCER